MAYTVPASPLTCQVRDAPCQLLFRRSLDERHPQGLSDRRKRARSPPRGIEFRDKVSRCFADREDVDPRKSGYLARNAKLLSARSVHPLDSPRSTLGWRRPANDRADDGASRIPRWMDFLPLKRISLMASSVLRKLRIKFSRRGTETVVGKCVLSDAQRQADKLNKNRDAACIMRTRR